MPGYTSRRHYTVKDIPESNLCKRAAVQQSECFRVVQGGFRHGRKCALRVHNRRKGVRHLQQLYRLSLSNGLAIKAENLGDTPRTLSPAVSTFCLELAQAGQRWRSSNIIISNLRFTTFSITCSATASPIDVSVRVHSADHVTVIISVRYSNVSPRIDGTTFMIWLDCVARSWNVECSICPTLIHTRL